MATLEEALYEFIIDNEKNEGDGLTLHHINLNFEHPDKPTKRGRTERDPDELMKDMPMRKRYKWGDSVAFCVNIEHDPGNYVQHEEEVHVHDSQSAAGQIAAAVELLHECLELTTAMKQNVKPQAPWTRGTSWLAARIVSANSINFSTGSSRARQRRLFARPFSSIWNSDRRIAV